MNEQFLEKLKQYDEKSIDQLCKVYDRNTADELVNFLIDNKIPFSIAFTDFDDFKSINDILGHQVGDFALKEISSAMKESVKDKGVIARYGGDEFLVIMPDIVTYDDVWQTVKVLCDSVRAINDTKIMNIASALPVGKITVTIGVARYPEDALDFDHLFELVDKALYRGKLKGKNCFIIYNKALHANLKHDFTSKKIGIEKLINYIFLEFTSKERTIENNLRAISKFLASHYGVSAISKTKKDLFEILHHDDTLDIDYIPIDLYEYSGSNEDNNLYYYERFKDIKPKLAEKFEQQKIWASILIKCATASQVYGYLRIDSRRERIWTREEKLIFQLVGNLYALLLETKKG